MNTFPRLMLVGVFGVLVLCAADVRAQDPVDTAVAHVGIGAGVNFYDPSSSDGKTSQGFALAYRWHSFHSGWGPTFGLDWHTTDFDQSIGSATVPLGSVRMRSLLAGFGHTSRKGRFSASANITGGYSFNHLAVASAMVPTFAGSGVSVTGVHVNDSFVAKPELSLWYDVFRHAGIGVSAAYFVSRPEEVMEMAGDAEMIRHIRADALELTAGVTFGVWKKK